MRCNIICHLIILSLLMFLLKLIIKFAAYAIRVRYFTKIYIEVSFNDNSATKIFNSFINDESPIHMVCMDKLSVKDQS